MDFIGLFAIPRILHVSQRKYIQQSACTRALGLLRSETMRASTIKEETIG